MKTEQQLAIVGAAVVIAAGIGIGVAFSSGGGSASSGKPVPSWCLDSPKFYNSPSHGAGCVNIIGCAHVTQVTNIDDTLAKENPIGSSGYGGADDPVTLLKQLQTINDVDRNEPNIHPVIKAGLDANAKDLQDEINTINAQGDWTDLQFNRFITHDESAVCTDFMADEGEGKTPTVHTDHPTLAIPTPSVPSF